MKAKTIIEILVNLYQMATAEEIIDGETDEPIAFKKYQKMIKDEVLELSDVVGVKIERDEAK